MLRTPRLSLALLLTGLCGWGCTLHHVRDELPYPITLAGEPASVSVERGPGPLGGERILVTVQHSDRVDLDGAIGSEAELLDRAGLPLDICQRLNLDRSDLGEGRAESRALFQCRWPLSQEASLGAVGAGTVPVLGPGGLEVMGARPWLFSAWVRAELAARVTGPVAAQGEDLGASFGARGLLLSHLGLGGRADVLVDAVSGRGQFIAGPELGFVHSTWPCARCSAEASLSYFVGYDRGFAHGPELDLRFGVRIARTGQNWHGIEAGVGYRQLIGPESGGALVFTLSYVLQTGLRWGVLPPSLRAPQHELRPPEPQE